MESREHASCGIDLLFSARPWNDDGRPPGVLSSRVDPGTLQRARLILLGSLLLSILLVGSAVGVRHHLDGKRVVQSARS